MGGLKSFSDFSSGASTNKNIEEAASKELTPKEIKDHVDFLTNTLIPDLKESGTTATAEDFEKCVKIINQLSKYQAKATDLDKETKNLNRNTPSAEIKKHRV